MQELKRQMNFILRNIYNLKSSNPQMSKQSQDCKQNTGLFILLESFCPLNYILEVFHLCAISLHIFCYLQLEFVYQNLLHFSQAWDSTKMYYWHSLQHKIFAALTFSYAFIREIIIQNFPSELLSVCPFRCKGNQSQTIAA